MECFTVYTDEIEGRIDPHFYKPEFMELEKQLIKLKHKKLEGVIEFSNETWNQKDFFEDEFPYIEISEIDIHSGEIQNITYYEKSKAPSRAKMIVRESDIIVSTTRPHRGAISFIDREKNGFIASTGFAILRKIKLENVKKEYLLFYLRTQLSLKQMLQRSSGGNYPAITSEELKKIIIPLPDEKTQNKTIQIMENACSLEKSKETEAQHLLASINDYVLDELGIKLPELKDKMMYVVNVDEVKGKRLDPKKYSEKPKAILRAITESMYPKINLSEIIINSVAGEWGEGKDYPKSNNYVLCKVLRNTNFDNRFNLNFDDIVERLIPKEKFDKIKLQTDDILIEKSGGSPIQPVGRVALITNIEDNFTFSNFLQRLILNKNKCSPQYLFSYLRAIYSLNYMEYLQNQTTGIKNLIMEEFLEIPVALPPLSIQNKIADEVKKRMHKAELLQKEAKEELEKAKAEVERIILG